MKIQLTLIVFREGQNVGELDVLCEFSDPLAAIRAVAQLGAANSLLYSHPDVRALLEGVPKSGLPRLHERMPAGTVVQIKDVRETREEMPEEIRRSPNAYHLIASRPGRRIPPEGTLHVQRDGTTH